MKKPAVDYRNLRLGDPQYSHLKLLWGWVGYFLLFFLTERYIPPERCHVMWCTLDDKIPFCEGFAIFYVGWYGLVAGSLVYFLLYDIPAFCNLQTYLIITQILGMSACILYPSRQDLRPETFPRENILTAVMGFIYRIDTNTGVFPSMHVAYSVAVASVWLRRKTSPLWVRLALTTFCFGVCLSVVFVKQHSVLDILGAIPVCLAAEWFVYGKGFRCNREDGMIK